MPLRINKLFTLVELIIVMAILSILLSLLQPTIRSMTINAHTLGCANNLRHHHQVIILYTLDNDGNFTTRGKPGGGFSLDTMWFTLLGEYHDQSQHFRICPSTESNPKTFQWGTATRAWNWGREQGSYALNAFFSSMNYNLGDRLTDMPNQFSRFYYINVSRVESPEQTGLMADSSWVSVLPRNFSNGPVSSALGGQVGESHMARLTVNRHDWATNVLKADGTVMKHSLEELYDKVFWNLSDKRQDAPIIAP